MQLGGLNPIGQTQPQQSQFSSRDFDFSALERKVDSIQKTQMYILIALAVIVIFNFRNGKN
jgi:hypothetical protein